MAEIVAVTRFGPDTYEVNAAVTGGMLVEPDTGGKVRMVSAVTSTAWLGVALYDAQPAGTTGEDTVWNQPRVDLGVPQKDVAVAYTGTFKLLAGEALNFGDRVYPAAGGGVQKTTTTGRLVGIVTEPLGIANGARGRVRFI